MKTPIKLYDALTTAHVSHDVAEDVANTMEQEMDALVTKQDLKQELQDFESRLDTKFTLLKEQIRNQTWGIGFIIATLAVGVVALLLEFMK